MSGELTDVGFPPLPNGEPQWVHLVKTADKTFYVNGCRMPPDVAPFLEGWLTKYRNLEAHGGGHWVLFDRSN